MRYGMVIDLKRCIGCHTCSMACKAMNNIPEGVWWNRIVTIGGDHMDTPEGIFPDLKMQHMPINCQHCENPACIKVCPVGATYKDADTGIIRQDYQKCIGCRMCMAACPYTGVRSFNWEDPKYAIDVSTGDVDVPKHQKHVVEKCTFCNQQLAKDKKPACMELCPGRARYFGDLDDSGSEISTLIREREYKQLLASEGTNPSVYYLV